MADLPTSVLFACNFNAVRSPMAEGITKHLFGHRIYVDSVGVRQGELDPFAVAVAIEIGIDVSRHQPKTFEDLQDTNYDLVISLTPEAQHRAVELTRTMSCDLEYWASLDPTGIAGSRAVRLAAYREVRDALFQRIQQRFGGTGGPSV